MDVELVDFGRRCQTGARRMAREQGRAVTLGSVAAQSRRATSLSFWRAACQNFQHVASGPADEMLSGDSVSPADISRTCRLGIAARGLGQGAQGRELVLRRGREGEIVTHPPSVDLTR